MRLYDYWRSTAAYRVRIALNLKGLEAEQVSVDLAGGAQEAEDYAAVNPAHLVPALVLADGTVLTQSLAIIDYLDRIVPDPPMLPEEPVARARATALAHTIAMDIHPVNNLRVVTRLGEVFGALAEERRAWMHHWMRRGFDAYEALLPHGTRYSAGDAPMLPDICLAAQLYNAKRWGLDLGPWPRISEIGEACAGLDAFRKAAPEAQPDAPQE